MRKGNLIFAGVALAVIATQAAAITPADSVEIWKAGCTDFKRGMQEGDFQKWLRIPDKDPRHSTATRAAIVRIYMGGWDMARGLNGVADCDSMSMSARNR